ncbi:POM121-like protein 12 [Oryctolagus cuniculus]|uniref:POM121-like protein 12 n=1 Tax=Oryctolagus cuniculus TaxID=9986 RepID=UPI00387A352D
MGLHLSKYLLAYLGEPRASLPPRAEEHRSPQPGSARRRLVPEPCQASLVQVKHWTWVRHFPATPPRRDYAQSRRAKVQVACGNLPRRLRPASLQGVSLYHARMSCRHRWLWQNRSSPVTVRISATSRPESLYKSAVIPERPDPCARETVLKALSQCNKGKRKFDGPLWFETPEPKKRKQSPARTPSAFKPVPRNGVVRAFVPKPGKLKRSVRSRGTECARKRAAGSCSSAAPRPALQAASARSSSDKEPRSLRQGAPSGQERTQPAAPGGC